jgi:hypothetical protein
LTAAIVVLLVTISGLLLNHTSSLALAKKPVHWQWLLSFYGVTELELTSFSAGEAWVSASDKGGSEQTLYFNGEVVGICEGRLVGAVVHQADILAACSAEIILLSPKGDILDRIGSTYDLPLPVGAIGQCGGVSEVDSQEMTGSKVCFEAAGKLYTTDLQQLQWQQLPKTGLKNWSQQASLPTGLEQHLQRQLVTELNWERVALDLHSGRIGGNIGVWIVDIAAIGLLFLALSGFWLWYQRMRQIASRK